MRNILIGAASLNQTPLCWEDNTSQIIKALDIAKQQNISLLNFSELTLSGYGCEDAFHSPDTQYKSLTYLKKIIPFTQNIATVIGCPLYIGNALYNAAAFICNQKLHGFVLKRYLAGTGVHYEQRWFKPWETKSQTWVNFDGDKIPAGNLIFSLNGIKVGIEICEDSWSYNRHAKDLVKADVDIILNPSASHFSLGKLETRKRIILETSRFCHSIFVFTNMIGCESGRIIYDGGNMIANCGEMILQTKRFSFKRIQINSAVVDLDIGRIKKSQTPYYSPDFDSTPLKVIDIDFSLPFHQPEQKPFEAESFETSPDLHFEEFTRAVALGLFDYMKKTRSLGFVLSLSGGVDSSAIAILIHTMCLFIEKELPKDEFKKMFDYFFTDKEKGTLKELLPKILHCVYQSTENSSETTYNAAKKLSEALGFTFSHFDVNPILKEYHKLLEQTLNRPLNWNDDDIALQNIQARVRGPSIWFLANIKKALLVATSNRSEAAVGYATMDGDTCGGLSPIAGIDKCFLTDWMHWIQNKGPMGFHPISEVKLVTDQKPTAELRPKSSHQTDEQDLMPYDILNTIEKLFIREKKSLKEIHSSLNSQYGKRFNPHQLFYFVARFIRLWTYNQWKRERYAPAFHLDDDSLDPKSSLRYPILAGHFQEDILELKKELKIND